MNKEKGRFSQPLFLFTFYVETGIIFRDERWYRSMALIICPECGQQISDKAVNCPQCGYPVYLYISEQKNEKEEAADKVKCEYCGTMNEGHNTYCVSCGANLHITEETVPAMSAAEIDAQNENKPINVEPIISEPIISEPIKTRKKVSGFWIILSLIFFYPLGLWLLAYRRGELDSNWFTIVSLILFWPMGLIAMWHYRKFTLGKRILISLTVLIFMCTGNIAVWCIFCVCMVVFLLVAIPISKLFSFLCHK